MACQVAGCRFRLSHVTRGHQCGTCGEFGHGQQECGKAYKIKELRDNFGYHTVGAQFRCRVVGCTFSGLHTTDGHKCSECGGYGHRCVSLLSAQEDVACPICRVTSGTTEWIKTYVEAECPVCMQTTNTHVSKRCGHGMCYACLQRLS